MSELAELERRITDALDRIGAGLERLDGPAEADSGEVTALQSALEDEKTANAQLEERLKNLRRKGELRIKELEDEIDDIKSAAGEATAQAQQLRKANAELQQKLAAQAAAPAGEAGMADQSMKSELEGLRKMRDADRAELDGILSTLRPLLEDQINA